MGPFKRIINLELIRLKHIASILFCLELNIISFFYVKMIGAIKRRNMGLLVFSEDMSLKSRLRFHKKKSVHIHM